MIGFLKYPEEQRFKLQSKVTSGSKTFMFVKITLFKIFALLFTGPVCHVCRCFPVLTIESYEYYFPVRLDFFTGFLDCLSG